MKRFISIFMTSVIFINMLSPAYALDELVPVDTAIEAVDVIPSFDADTFYADGGVDAGLYGDFVDGVWTSFDGSTSLPVFDDDGNQMQSYAVGALALTAGGSLAFTVISSLCATYLIYDLATQYADFVTTTATWWYDTGSGMVDSAGDTITATLNDVGTLISSGVHWGLDITGEWYGALTSSGEIDESVSLPVIAYNDFVATVDSTETYFSDYDTSTSITYEDGFAVFPYGQSISTYGYSSKTKVADYMAELFSFYTYEVGTVKILSYNSYAEYWTTVGCNIDENGFYYLDFFNISKTATNAMGTVFWDSVSLNADILSLLGVSYDEYFDSASASGNIGRIYFTAEGAYTASLSDSSWFPYLYGFVDSSKYPILFESDTSTSYYCNSNLASYLYYKAGSLLTSDSNYRSVINPWAYNIVYLISSAITAGAGICYYPSRVELYNPYATVSVPVVTNPDRDQSDSLIAGLTSIQTGVDLTEVPMADGTTADLTEDMTAFMSPDVVDEMLSLGLTTTFIGTLTGADVYTDAGDTPDVDLSGITDWLQYIWETLMAIPTSIFDVFSSVLTSILTAIVSIPSSIYDVFSSVLTSMLTAIVSIPSAIYDYFSSILDSILTAIQSMTTAVTTFFETFYDWFAPTVDEFEFDLDFSVWSYVTDMLAYASSFFTFWLFFIGYIPDEFMICVWASLVLALTFGIIRRLLG